MRKETLLEKNILVFSFFFRRIKTWADINYCSIQGAHFPTLMRNNVFTIVFQVSNFKWFASDDAGGEERVGYLVPRFAVSFDDRGPPKRDLSAAEQDGREGCLPTGTLFTK